MATLETTFTKGVLDKVAHQGGAATRYRDARYPNLYMEVGARSKTWRFRKFWKGRNFTETLGTWPQMTVIEAAQTAAEINTRVEDTGVTRHDDRPRNAPEVTLRTAFQQHVTQALDPRQKKLTDATIADYEGVLRCHASDWLDLSISDISRQMVNERIKAMSDTPPTATKLLRALSAIYGTQLAYRDDGFEHDPTYRVKGYESAHRELLFDEAKRWPALDAIANVPNVTRRAAWLVLLFTGFRMRNVRELRWQDIDLDERVLTIPRLKNGQKRTFPLSDMAVDVFRLTPRTHDSIVFEGRHYGKPISNLRQIDKDGNDVDNGGVLRPHDTRHLFSSAAAKAGLSDPMINWMRGDVTIMRGAAGRYMHDLGSHEVANAVTKQIVAKCGPALPLDQLLTRA